MLEEFIRLLTFIIASITFLELLFRKKSLDLFRAVVLVIALFLSLASVLDFRSISDFFSFIMQFSLVSLVVISSMLYSRNLYLKIQNFMSEIGDSVSSALGEMRSQFSRRKRLLSGKQLVIVQFMQSNVPESYVNLLAKLLKKYDLLFLVTSQQSNSLILRRFNTLKVPNSSGKSYRFLQAMGVQLAKRCNASYFLQFRKSELSESNLHFSIEPLTQQKDMVVVYGSMNQFKSIHFLGFNRKSLQKIQVGFFLMKRITDIWHSIRLMLLEERIGDDITLIESSNTVTMLWFRFKNILFN